MKIQIKIGKKWYDAEGEIDYHNNARVRVGAMLASGLPQYDIFKVWRKEQNKKKKK